MGDLPKPAPTEQPKPVVAAAPSAGADIIDRVGAADGARSELIAEAKRRYEEGKNSVGTDTKAQLSELASGVKRTPEDEREINKMLLAKDAEKELEAFKFGVGTTGHDFMGKDSSDSELAENTVLKHVQGKMQEIYAGTNPNFDEARQVEWMHECTQFMVKEIASWSKALSTNFGEMDISDVDVAIAKMLDRKQDGGIGNFEEWMKAKYLKDYESQNAQVAQETQQQSATTEQQQALVAKKAEVTKIFEAAKGALPKEVVALPAMAQKLREISQKILEAKDVATFTGTEAAITKLRDIGTALAEASTSRKELERLNCPPDQLQRIDVIVQDIISSNGSNLATKQEDIKQVVINQKPMLDKLNILAVDADIPLEVRTTTIERVKQGKLEVEQAIKELADTKKLAMDVDKEPDADDKTLVGSIAKWAKKMPKLGWLASALTGISVALVKIPFIGDWFRGSMISNKMLAANGDKQAQVAYKTEKEFRRFRLDSSLALSLGNEPVSKALKTLEKPADLSSDPTEQARLAQLATQIKEKGGLLATTITLNDFIGNNPKWTEIRYDASASAVAEANAKAEAAKKTDAAEATPPAEGAAKVG